MSLIPRLFRLEEAADFATFPASDCAGVINTATLGIDDGLIRTVVQGKGGGNIDRLAQNREFQET